MVDEHKMNRSPSLEGLFFKSLTQLVVPFFKSEERKKAWKLLIILLFFLIGVSAVNVLLSYLGRDFITALSEKKAEAFYTILPKYLLAFVLATLIAVLYRFVEETLALVWRNWMTQHLLKKYFSARSYYLLQMSKEIDNPDQRITEDLKNFTATTLSLFLIVLNSTITIVAFVGVLASISSMLVFVLIFYAIVGTGLTVWIGKRLIRLHNRQYQKEATFRYGLVRVRDNAESIAFYRGEARERIDLMRRFKRVFTNSKALIQWNRKLGFFTTGYNYLALIVPTVIVAPLFLEGKIEFGVVTQAAGAFAQVLAAMSVIITQFERISAYAAGVFRLHGIWEAVKAKELKESDDDPEILFEEGQRLILKDLTVRPPHSDRVLVENLSLKVKDKSALLLMGPSGSGKSSILRTIAGLWLNGSGSIERPRLREIMFLPQRPYMPVGHLKAQLMYPSRRENGRGSDEALVELLRKVNLEDILKRVNGDLLMELDWSNVLSIGEQQRLAFARLLYHTPRLAFLDEATSALDEENEALLYSLAREAGITLMSVGHRSTLRKFHDFVLNLLDEGRWNIEKVN